MAVFPETMKQMYCFSLSFFLIYLPLFHPIESPSNVIFIHAKVGILFLMKIIEEKRIKNITLH